MYWAGVNWSDAKPNGAGGQFRPDLSFRRRVSCNQARNAEVSAGSRRSCSPRAAFQKACIGGAGEAFDSVPCIRNAEMSPRLASSCRAPPAGLDRALDACVIGFKVET